MKKTMITLLLLAVSVVCAGTAAQAQYQTVLGPKQYKRTTGQPNLYQDSFQARVGEAQLELFNGNLDGTGQVTSARVLVNGQQILGPKDFKRKVLNLQVPLQLAKDNSLSIELQGKPGSLLSLRMIQPTTFREEYPGGSKADLAVSALSVTPDRCTPGDLVSLRATVAANGRGQPPATFRFHVDGNELGHFPVPPLKRGEKREFTASWTAEGSGRHLISARVEPERSLDFNYGNNSRLQTVRVSGETQPVPELEFSLVEFAPFPQVEGQTSTVSITVRNPSFIPLSEVGVNFFIDGTPLALNNMGAPQVESRSIFSAETAFMDAGSGDDEVHIVDAVIPYLGPGETDKVEFSWKNITLAQHVLNAKLSHLPEFFPDSQKVASWNVVIPPETPASPSPFDYWYPMGPEKIMNYYDATNGSCGMKINTLALSPSNPNIIYAGAVNYGGVPASGGGIWRTVDGGQTWEPLGDKIEMTVTAVAVDPINPDIVYGACGLWGAIPPGPNPDGTVPIKGPIYKSINGGKKWHLFDHPGDGYRKLVVRRTPGGGQLVYAASNRGLFRYQSSVPDATFSNNTEWKRILSGHISDLAVHPTDNSTVYAVSSSSQSGPHRLFRTQQAEALPERTGDNDFTGWKDLFNKAIITQTVAIDIFPADPNKIYALYFDFQELSEDEYRSDYKLLSSNNEGDNWATEWDKAFVYWYPFEMVKFLRVHPWYPDLLYIGGVSLKRLFKFGPMWVGFAHVPGIHADQHDFAFIPGGPDLGSFLVANDGGVYRGDWVSGAERMTSLNNGLAVGQFVEVDVSQTHPNIMLGGTQDTGNLRYIAAEPYGRWQYVGAGDGGRCAIAQSNDQVIYANDTNGSLSTTIISKNGGDSWDSLEPQGITDVGLWNLVVDPNNWGHVLANGPQVQESDDNGKNWHPAGPGDNTAGQKKGDMRCIAFKPDDFTTWLAGTEQYGQIWQRTKGLDGYFYWSLLDLYLGEPSAVVWSIAFAPSDPDVAYVSYVNCTAPNRLRRFVNGFGESITGDFPSLHVPSHTPVQINHVVADPFNADVAYVATDKGVFRGIVADYASGRWHWEAYSQGLPLVDVRKLIPIPLTGEIRAATHGRGVWKAIPASPFEE